MQFFSEIAASYNTALIAGFVEKSNGNFYNTLAVINPDGSLQSAYRKIHPFGYAGEDEHYTAGEKPVTAEAAGVKTGLAVCYDLRFPELFRFYGKDEVPLIVIIANWPRQRIAHWRALLKARAIENLCFVAAVNRTGSDPKAVYNGYSSVFSPMGEEILTLPGESAVASIEIDTNEADAIKNKFPFLKDIRLI
jgi:predicted amidohydrolase